MLRRFLSTFVFGLLFALIAANFYPFPQVARFPSITEAVANGGREEVFRIRLPEDRLGDPRSATTAVYPVTAFAAAGSDRIVAELFQVRDAQNRVIGVASRLGGTVTTATGPAYTTDWMVVIPSRGALLLSRGSRPVEGQRELPADRLGLPATGTGALISGTGEFENLQGFFHEALESKGAEQQLVTLTTRLQAAAQ